jgi:hypothetical protein
MDKNSLDSARRFYDALGRGEVPPMMRVAAALVDSTEVEHFPNTEAPSAASTPPSTAQSLARNQSLLSR